ncbi:MAG: hypothetical protein Q9218_000741 [Villophora microphyllina]
MAPKGIYDNAMRGKLEQDHKRELNQKFKWAMGEAPRTAGCNKKRPARAPRSEMARATKREGEYNINKAAKMTRKSHVYVHGPSASDSSAEEDIREASAAPEPDAGIAYSYDAAHGPNNGGHILSLALAKAVEKYETKATEKLVMEDYEVVEKETDDASVGYSADDDFELV